MPPISRQLAMPVAVAVAEKVPTLLLATVTPMFPALYT